MKKLSIFLTAFIILIFAPVALATNNGVGAQGTNFQQPEVKPSLIRDSVQNQKRIETQNMGEDTNLQVSVQEQESSQGGIENGSQDRSQIAIENMNRVATRVQNLLQMRTSGGIGDQVRQIAQEQNQAQDRIQAQINKIEERSNLLKSLIGPDFKGIKEVQSLMEQNQMRIQKLEELKEQLTNQSDITMIEEAIQALVDQNTALQDRVNLEESSNSLFGWLVKLFVR